MNREDARALWEQVQENSRALDACVGPHDFQDITPEKKIGKRYRCSYCRGEIDSINHHWYQHGLAHGRL